MYDREAMYMEFMASQYSFDPEHVQGPYAVRPYVGGINAISGKTVREQSSGVSPTNSEIRGKMRVEEKPINECLASPPSSEQDYIVADASAQDVSVRPQWLDGIAMSPGRVKQFVAVPLGSEKSVGAQKIGKDSTGGIQLEIIPSLPLSRLRRHLGQQITIYTINLAANKISPVRLDAGALVWDYMNALYLQDNIPINQVRCSFRGKPKEPLGRLSHYDVVDQSSIHIILKLRGGGFAPPIPKRMAIGAGGAISQNSKRDLQDPAIWDPSRAIRLNIQILNSLAFEELTGLVTPPTPISFNKYKSLGIHFFQYYIEDAQAISGDLAVFSLWARSLISLQRPPLQMIRAGQRLIKVGQRLQTNALNASGDRRIDCEINHAHKLFLPQFWKKSHRRYVFFPDSARAATPSANYAMNLARQKLSPSTDEHN